MTLIQLDGRRVPFPETGNARKGPRWGRGGGEGGDHEVSLGFRVPLGHSSRATRGHLDIQVRSSGLVRSGLGVNAAPCTSKAGMEAGRVAQVSLPSTATWGP